MMLRIRALEWLPHFEKGEFFGMGVWPAESIGYSGGISQEDYWLEVS